MAQFIKIFIVIPLVFSVFLWRNHNIHVLRKSLFDDFVAVITLIREQPLGENAVNQGASFFTVMNGTRCNKYSDRHTIRIHGQMYFGVKPPFVTPMSWLPPTAPAA